MGLALGYGLGLRNQLAFGGKTIPTKPDALVWLDGTISGNNFVDKISGRLFPIANKDFPTGWVKGFPYKSAATFSAPAGDAALISKDTTNFWYARNGNPNQIKISDLLNGFNNILNTFFWKINDSTTLLGNEKKGGYVSDITIYNTQKSNGDLINCNNYFGYYSKYPVYVNNLIVEINNENIKI